VDVRLLEKEDIPEAKALWKEAFGDSDAFINWYFRHKVMPGNSLGLFDGGLVSMLHMIPFTIRLQGKPVKSLMIAGAATKQERRGEGHMRVLLLEALMEMRSRGVFITHLYPFKHSFYERFGWTAYSHVHRAFVTDAPLRRDIEVIETDDYHALESVYKRMMGSFDGYIVRGSREWRWRMGELKADGGHTALLIKNDAIRAYMLYYVAHKRAEVVETAYTDEEDVGALLSHILRQGYGRVNYFLPAESRGSKFGMARVVDAEALLRFFGAEALLKDVNISDGFASWNNLRSQTAGNDLDIADLARLVHTGQITAASEVKFILKDYDTFSKRTTCIFEMY
jgi:GNAT superfamily N-acetyltransferase